MSEEDLSGLFNKTECYCLNEDSVANHTNLFEAGSTLLTSNADEQLLIHLSLRQTVKLTSIALVCPSDDSCPQTIHMFANKSNMDFDQANAVQPTQSVTLAPGGGRVKIPLQATKWQRCDSITMFVVDNHGADLSSIQQVQLYGKPMMGADVSQIKPC